MGIIVNPRGTGGSGKTWLVRRIMAGYGPAAPIHRPGRARPIGFRLPHPAGGRPLAVLGDYGRSRGGCDTIPRRDGGMEEAMRLAGCWATEGHDVLLEGFSLSTEHARTAALAERHALHVIHLATPAEACARALAVRRRLRRNALPRLAEEAARIDAGVTEACRHLRGLGVAVERCMPDAAYRRIRGLLGLEAGGTVAPLRADRVTIASGCVTSLVR